jgi:hypothetical protein
MDAAVEVGMDPNSIAERLQEERVSLRLVAEALRRRLWETGTLRPAVGELHHLDFLLEILQRHASRVFELAAQRECLDYAVEWQDFELPVAVGRELHRELEALAADARALSTDSAPEDVCDFLDRLGRFLDREQRVCGGGPFAVCPPT